MYLPDYIKMVVTPLVINIFHETCTIGFSTHRAINPCQKLSFYEKLQMVYFSIAGHIYAYSNDCSTGDLGVFMLLHELVETSYFTGRSSKIVVGNGGLNSNLGFQCRSHNTHNYA